MAPFTKAANRATPARTMMAVSRAGILRSNCRRARAATDHAVTNHKNSLVSARLATVTVWPPADEFMSPMAFRTGRFLHRDATSPRTTSLPDEPLALYHAHGLRCPTSQGHDCCNKLIAYGALRTVDRPPLKNARNA